MPSALVHYVKLDVPNITQSSSFVGMFRSLSGLEVSFDVFEYAEGGNNDFVHHLPGGVRYPNLVLAWGITTDPLLQQWFFKTHVQAQLTDITLTLTAQKGDSSSDLRTFAFTDAYPVRWSGPVIASESPDMWGETLEIAHGGLKLT